MCAIQDFSSIRELKAAEDRWAAKGRLMLLSDPRISNLDEGLDEYFIWATTLNTLACEGKISYRQEHMMLRPGSEKNPYALSWD